MREITIHILALINPPKLGNNYTASESEPDAALLLSTLSSFTGFWNGSEDINLPETDINRVWGVGQVMSSV